MVEFIDGPAVGKFLDLKRAPAFIRLTEDNGKFGALDQIGDEPKASENITVYILTSPVQRYHLKRSGKYKGQSGWKIRARYKQHSEQPEDGILRDNEQWQSWATDNFERLESVGRQFDKYFSIEGESEEKPEVEAQEEETGPNKDIGEMDQSPLMDAAPQQNEKAAIFAPILNMKPDKSQRNTKQSQPDATRQEVDTTGQPSKWDLIRQYAKDQARVGKGSPVGGQFAEENRTDKTTDKGDKTTDIETPVLADLPVGFEFSGWKKHEVDGIKEWTKDGKALTDNMLQATLTPEEKTEIAEKLNPSTPEEPPEAQLADETERVDSDPAPDPAEQEKAIKSIASLFGQTKGRALDPKKAGNFVINAAENLGHNPQGKTREERTADAAEFLDTQTAKIDGMLAAAEKIGYKGKAQSLVTRARGAAQFMTEQAAEMGFEPTSNDWQQNFKDATEYLKEQAQQTPGQPRS